MFDKVMSFIKEHKVAIIGTTAAVAGMIVAYSCGRRHVIGQMQGYNFVTYFTKEREWATELNTFLQGCVGKEFDYLAGNDVPVETLAENVSDSIKLLEMGGTRANVLIVTPIEK